MAQAKVGDRVKVHFSGVLEDGTVFASSFEQEPFEFTIGDKRVLPGFENALIGMNEGDTKTVSIAPEDGYGYYREDLLFAFKKSDFPADMQLELGQTLQMRLQDGTKAFVVIKSISDEEVLLDANSPLAGQTLQFEIQLIEIL